MTNIILNILTVAVISTMAYLLFFYHPEKEGGK